MRTVRAMRLRPIITLVVLAALAGTSAALAARGDPKEAITPADQARAKAMLLRAADFSPAYTASPAASRGGGDLYCAALDESDLTVSGRAESPRFTATPEFITSTAYVYKSRSGSNASWARGTSAAGVNCLRDVLRAQLQGTAVRFVSFKKLSFPKRGQRSVSYRAIATQQGLRLYVDVVAMQVVRAQAAVIYLSGLSPPPEGELRRLTALVAKRAERAMRVTS